MGQYYKTVTIKDKEITDWYQPVDFKAGDKDNFDEYIGVKLMEHSWIGNAKTNAVSHHIFKNPCQVAWVGDYCESSTCKNELISQEEYLKKCDEVYDTDNGYFEKQGFDYKGKWLVNHSKKIAFPFPKYKKKEWNIYPLSLLTACGNGLGGGDYHGANQYLCGTWAFDVISIEEEKPEGYEEVETPYFQE